jgi:hypothetical protein
MKKCMKCGGPKMKNGGQPYGTIVTPIYNASTRPTTMRKGGIKKYNNGGATSLEDIYKEDRKLKNMFGSPSAKAGLGMLGAGFGAIGTAIGLGKRKANKEKKAAENTPEARFTKKMDETLKTQKRGGVIKNSKLAAVAKPKNKITRADVLTRILKKKKG